MSTTYLIIEMFIAAAFAVLTLLFSERFLMAGFRRWGWMLAGFILIIIGGAIEAAFSVRSFAQLFVPSVAIYADGFAHALRLLGLVFVLVTFLVSVLSFYKERIHEQKRQDRFVLLDIIRETASQSLSLIELVNFSVRELVRGTDSNAGCIFIYNPKRKQLVLAAHRDLPRQLEKKLESIENDGSIFFRSQKSSRPHVIGNIANADSATSSLLSDSDYKSAVAVPLVGRNGSFGVAALFSEDSYFYSTETTQLINSAANILGPAVASLRLERELREASLVTRKSKKSQLYISGLLDICGRSGSPEVLIKSLTRYSSEYLGIENVEIYRLSGSNPVPVLPGSGLIGQSRQIKEHLRRAVDQNKSLLVKTESNGDVERTLIMPLQRNDGKYVCLFEIDPRRPDLKQDDLEKIKALSKAIAIQLVVYDEKKAPVLAGRAEDLKFNELNNLNNILTGILGNAQLVDVSLKRESFSGRERVLENLKHVIEETYDAGQMIKNLQEKIQTGRPRAEEVNTLESAIKSIAYPEGAPEKNIYHLKQKPSIRFDLAAARNGALDLSTDQVVKILTHVLSWVDKEWRPDSPLSMRLVNTAQGVNLVISDFPLKDKELDLSSIELMPLELFPEVSIADLNSDVVDIDYYYEDSEQGRVLILRFPSSAPPGEVIRGQESR
ncbi:MAG: GAF domain-containing protein, partial [candidate division Zixibacteria bacterium]|nr:GAF domain-containing protein [candidate division Zixibacteria bacterium]NIR66626.1 GAF domain-containing protein [candidate division Zixibacteria bacterium]NIS14756.1 GAF domain-containing protein [candidate division Zixibacteria bacterium]NIS48185.1 GAF domain-containing protein [candidate division Zixibacteria bacterium]NIT51298.1 GAF domain-containing protein [candidate division Zixibacteria bacterium]